MRYRSFLAFVTVVCFGCMGEKAGENRMESPNLPANTDSVRRFALMTASERQELRDRLRREGRYDCCMKPGCMECIGKDDSCACYLDIKNNDPICGECMNGYKEGKGKLKLVSVVELERIRSEAQRTTGDQ